MTLRMWCSFDFERATNISIFYRINTKWIGLNKTVTVSNSVNTFSMGLLEKYNFAY